MRITLPQEGAWATLGDHLRDRLHSLTAQEVAYIFTEGRIAAADGRLLTQQEPYVRGEVVFLRRELRPEPEVPFDIPVLHEDERILVVDKPHFLATMPRGQHITQTAVARLRVDHGLPDLTAAHRLDRLTAGVLLLVKQIGHRGAYQQLFARRECHKLYEAIAPRIDGFVGVDDVALHLHKVRGDPATRIDPWRTPNAHTAVRILEEQGSFARYELEPHTGRTHQLRATLNHLDAPIVGDPLYPVVRRVSSTDYSNPLLLLARQLAFRDPVTGQDLEFRSARHLPWPG
ncbi:RluA family pseudouridine synthase [Calidifontibacter terrae]